MTRVSVYDLQGAADWLRAYEGPDGVIGDNGAGGDERAVELLRVAEWIDAEVARRQREQHEREVARKAGLDPNDPVARRRVRAAMESVEADRRERVEATS